MEAELRKLWGEYRRGEELWARAKGGDAEAAVQFVAWAAERDPSFLWSAWRSERERAMDMIIPVDWTYGVVVVRDRYEGTYSGARYTALHSGDPRAWLWDGAWGDDLSCAAFYAHQGSMVGLGDSPVAALNDLLSKRPIPRDGSYI